MTLCRYCERDRPLIDAHIVPAAFCREMLSAGDPSLLLVPKNPTERQRRVPIGPYDQNILCRDCENRFERLDDYAARLLIRDRDRAFRKEPGVEDAIYVADGVEYARLKLFVISVLWRASVSTLDFCRQVDLGPRIDRVKQMLETNDPGGPLEFATILGRWIETPGHPLPAKLVASPVSRRYDGARGVRLYLGHFIVDVCTSRDSFKSPLSELAIAPGKPVVAIGFELNESPEVAAFRRARLNEAATRAGGRGS